ncbi:hypothetical protein SAMN05443668_103308 [Cryptosporangium aurantiacum]|uniref:Uncharacterized protein n=1 Tax=Cryptosporangium aurantiacum TaxID=134849 RepID=A0A1M7PFQ0_9ACTN|nr:hypothetical protein SAMN05443668_103308 [Cryptosporangium aurantiacum]
MVDTMYGPIKTPSQKLTLQGWQRRSTKSAPAQFSYGT